MKITDRKKEKVDEVIHQYMSEQASHRRCFLNWSKARKEILEMALGKR